MTVIDGTGAPARAGMSVVVTSGRVSAAGSVDSVGAISPPGADAVDASGQFLIPGLWDMHVHVGGLDGGMRAGPALIAHGVTGVRDMASPLDEILTLRNRWQTASPSGPRLVAVGPILQGPLPFELPLIRSVATTEEARTAVDDLHRAGVDFIKVGDTVPPDAYRAVVDRARQHGLPVAGHLPVGISAAAAALAGQRSIEHFGSARFHGLLLASSSEEGPLTRRVQELLDAARRGEPAADTHLFRADPAGGRPCVGPLPGDGPAHAQRRCVDSRRHGSAARWGFSLHQELELLVEAGLSPAEAIAAATSQATAFLGLIDDLGTIEAGKRADLVLLDRDPLANITNTRRIAAVIVGGVFLNRTKLVSVLASPRSTATR